MSKFQYVVEKDCKEPWLKYPAKFFTDGREAVCYARQWKEKFPYHRVRITIYREVE